MTSLTADQQYADLAARIEALQDEIFDAWKTASSEEDDLRAENMEIELTELRAQADELSPALRFARWLQLTAGLIGEDVDIDRLYRQWAA
jgi:hypothetical protein